MLSNIFPKEGQVVKAHFGSHLFYAQVTVKQQLLDAAHNRRSDEFAGSVVTVPATDTGQVFRRDTKFVGIGFDAAVHITILGKQEHEAPEDSVALLQHIVFLAVVQVPVNI